MAQTFPLTTEFVQVGHVGEAGYVAFEIYWVQHIFLSNTTRP